LIIKIKHSLGISERPDKQAMRAANSRIFLVKLIQPKRVKYFKSTIIIKQGE